MWIDGGRLFRECWIDGVRKHYPGEPKASYTRAQKGKFVAVAFAGQIYKHISTQSRAT